MTNDKDKSTNEDLSSEPSWTTRTFEHKVRVLLSDTDPKGDLRADALARYLHDAATLDIEETKLDRISIWVLRSMSIEVKEIAHYLDSLRLVTYCSGTGKAWAQRSTDVYRYSEKIIDTRSIWVNVGGVRQGAKALPSQFFDVYGPDIGNIEVSAQHRLKTPKNSPIREDVFELRHSDLDVMDHVNNAIHLVFVEETLKRAGLHSEATPRSLLVEFRDALEIEPNQVTSTLFGVEEKVFHVELSQGSVKSRARVRFA